MACQHSHQSQDFPIWLPPALATLGLSNQLFGGPWVGGGEGTRQCFLGTSVRRETGKGGLQLPRLAIARGASSKPSREQWQTTDPLSLGGVRESGWVSFSRGASLHCGFLAGRDGMTIFGQRQTPKKRRKSRTAFTNHQIYELEKRFLYQKYLSPADRDQIAQQLGLTNAQVITWFQNRRAKLKRDLEEMKADVESAKKLGPSGQMDIVALAELEQNSEAAGGGGGGGCGRAKSRPGSPALPPGVPQAPGAGPLQLSPASPLTDQPASSQDCSEDEEDEEIDVDD